MHPELEGWNLSTRITLLPKDTNQHGTIFGGVILSHIDIAGSIEAKRFCQQEVVTVAMKEVIFKEPVFVGDLISFYTRITHTGRTSITVEVSVITFSQNDTSKSCLVTDAEVTYVAIDENRKPAPIVIRKQTFDPPAFSNEFLQERLGTERSGD